MFINFLFESDLVRVQIKRKMVRGEVFAIYPYSYFGEVCFINSHC